MFFFMFKMRVSFASSFCVWFNKASDKLLFSIYALPSTVVGQERKHHAAQFVRTDIVVGKMSVRGTIR